MSRTECPKNWTDNSEDAEEYNFKIEKNAKFAMILKREWMDETQWKLRIGTDDGSFLSRSVETAGEFDDIADAVNQGESWLDSNVKSVFEFIG